MVFILMEIKLKSRFVSTFKQLVMRFLSVEWVKVEFSVDTGLEVHTVGQTKPIPSVFQYRNKIKFGTGSI
jgi:hypothetical protein